MKLHTYEYIPLCLDRDSHVWQLFAYLPTGTDEKWKGRSDQQLWVVCSKISRQKKWEERFTFQSLMFHTGYRHTGSKNIEHQTMSISLWSLVSACLCVYSYICSRLIWLLRRRRRRRWVGNRWGLEGSEPHPHVNSSPKERWTAKERISVSHSFFTSSSPSTIHPLILVYYYKTHTCSQTHKTLRNDVFRWWHSLLSVSSSFFPFLFVQTDAQVEEKRREYEKREKRRLDMQWMLVKARRQCLCENRTSLYHRSTWTARLTAFFCPRIWLFAFFHPLFILSGLSFRSTNKIFWHVCVWVQRQRDFEIERSSKRRSQWKDKTHILAVDKKYTMKHRNEHVKVYSENREEILGAIICVKESRERPRLNLPPKRDVESWGTAGSVFFSFSFSFSSSSFFFFSSRWCGHGCVSLLKLSKNWTLYKLKTFSWRWCWWLSLCFSDRLPFTVKRKDPVRIVCWLQPDVQTVRCCLAELAIYPWIRNLNRCSWGRKRVWVREGNIMCLSLSLQHIFHHLIFINTGYIQLNKCCIESVFFLCVWDTHPCCESASFVETEVGTSWFALNRDADLRIFGWAVQLDCPHQHHS